jgi:hypothetical protein
MWALGGSLLRRTPPWRDPRAPPIGAARSSPVRHGAFIARGHGAVGTPATSGVGNSSATSGVGMPAYLRLFNRHHAWRPGSLHGARPLRAAWALVRHERRWALRPRAAWALVRHERLGTRPPLASGALVGTSSVGNSSATSGVGMPAYLRLFNRHHAWRPGSLHGARPHERRGPSSATGVGGARGHERRGHAGASTAVHRHHARRPGSFTVLGCRERRGAFGSPERRGRSGARAAWACRRISGCSIAISKATGRSTVLAR